MDVEQELVKAIAERTGREPEPSDRLDRLGIDSLDMAGFLRELERHFRITVDEEVFDLQTLDELARYIEQRRAG